MSLATSIGLLVAAAARAGSPPALVQLDYSADISTQLAPSAVFAPDHDWFRDIGGVLTRVQLPNLPDRVDLDALHIDSNGDVLFSLDVGTNLNGFYYDRADAIRFAGGVYSLAFDASAAGVPAGVDLDALTRRNGRLLVSFDRALTAGSTYFPGDVIEVNGTALGSKIIDADALGLARALDIDAIDALSSTSHLLISFRSGAAIGAVVFADEDLLEFDLGSASWRLRVDMSVASNRWERADLDAVAATSDVIFMNGFE